MSTTTKERPILFSGPMVRAILDGHTTKMGLHEIVHRSLPGLTDDDLKRLVAIVCQHYEARRQAADRRKAIQHGK